MENIINNTKYLKIQIGKTFICNNKTQLLITEHRPNSIYPIVAETVEYLNIGRKTMYYDYDGRYLAQRVNNSIINGRDESADSHVFDILRPFIKLRSGVMYETYSGNKVICNEIRNADMRTELSTYACILLTHNQSISSIETYSGDGRKTVYARTHNDIIGYWKNKDTEVIQTNESIIKSDIANIDDNILYYERIISGLENKLSINKDLVNKLINKKAELLNVIKHDNDSK